VDCLPGNMKDVYETNNPIHKIIKFLTMSFRKKGLLFIK
jgi:hypothetical protein